MAADVEPEDRARLLPRRRPGSSASLTPPALPRPPVSTCALTTTRPPSSSAAARASSGVVATPPSETGIPKRAKSSLPWCSYRSTGATVVGGTASGARSARCATGVCHRAGSSADAASRAASERPRMRGNGTAVGSPSARSGSVSQTSTSSTRSGGMNSPADLPAIRAGLDPETRDVHLPDVDAPSAAEPDEEARRAVWASVRKIASSSGRPGLPVRNPRLAGAHPLPVQPVAGDRVPVHARADMEATLGRTLHRAPFVSGAPRPLERSRTTPERMHRPGSMPT